MTPSMQTVLDRLERHGPMTILQLAKQADMSKTYMSKCIATLHREEHIHVSAWPVQSNGAKAALWKAGCGDDATNHVGRPSIRGSLLKRIKDLIPECGPFACLIGQMGAGR